MRTGSLPGIVRPWILNESSSLLRKRIEDTYQVQINDMIHMNRFTIVNRRRPQ